jgi:transposase-like protein
MILTPEEVRIALVDRERADLLLAEYRWGVGREGFACPRCGITRLPGRAAGTGLRCRACRTVVHGLSGTLLDKTRVNPAAVLWMVWILATRPGGVSAVEASRETGVSREGCQHILGVLRHALSADEKHRVLKGRVEADETFLGGHARDQDQPGRSPSKQCVLVLAERGTNGRIVLAHTPDAKARTLLPRITRHVETGSMILTDGHKPYLQLGELGYQHEAHVIRGSGVRAHVLLPAVHQVAGTLKDQLYGTHKRTPAPHLTQDYLGAFQWRYNRRSLAPERAFTEALGVLVGSST